MLSPKTLLPLCCSLILLLVCSCDFLTDENFNTSQNSTENFVFLNVDGTYSGALDGGVAVDPKTGDSITSLQLLQNDDSILIQDSLNNQYVGTIGFPTSPLDSSAIALPADTVLATVEVNATGVDSSANSGVVISGSVSLLTNTFVAGQDSVSTRLLFSGDWLETAGTNGVIQAVRDGGVRKISDFY